MPDLKQELDWLLDSYISYLMACENEYGGPRAAYKADEERAANLISLLKDEYAQYRNIG